MRAEHARGWQHKAYKYCRKELADHLQRLRIKPNTLAANADGHAWQNDCRRLCSTTEKHAPPLIPAASAVLVAADSLARRWAAALPFVAGHSGGGERMRRRRHHWTRSKSAVAAFSTALMSGILHLRVTLWLEVRAQGPERDVCSQGRSISPAAMISRLHERL